MAIELNFGWLNDYTGSRFAPITLANLVLMETSNGSAETLYDYVTDKISGFTDLTNVLTSRVDDNYNNLYLLLQDEPIDKEGKKIKTAKAAQRAVMLVGGARVDGNIDILDADGNIMDYGLKVGSGIIPVYFNEGVPESCNEKENISFEYKYTGVNSAGELQEFNLPVKSIKPERSWNTALAVDISGAAQYAGISETAIFAKQSEYAKVTDKSLALKGNIKIGGTYYEEDNKYHNYVMDEDGNIMTNPLTGKLWDNGISGDVVGVVQTSNPDEISSLELKDMEWVQGEDKIWRSSYLGGANDISLGNAFIDDEIEEGVVFIPSLQIDSKGRVVAAHSKNYEIIAKLALENMPGPNSTDKVYLMGVNDKYTDKKNVVYYHTKGSLDSNSIYIDVSGSEPVLMGAAWNDYAEYRKQKETIEPGYCVKSNDDGRVEKTSERLSICDGIVSDTFGFSIGKHADYETPLAVSGRVLAYCEGSAHDYHAGDVVCASKNGKVCVMTREEIKEYPDRIVGTVSEIPSYDNWNGKNINGRIWIKVK